eukprot:TRINITY_DN27703_c0_g1_i1.p1 TRINITY_DN27703_c0_g1~~TRINITY_DN27703_c0_g1_i1.p1  ORF type:complete len:426 (+),score=41.71 TRINITY_DN27703_c0_g1_i1:59-1279(+)
MDLLVPNNIVALYGVHNKRFVRMHGDRELHNGMGTSEKMEFQQLPPWPEFEFIVEAGHDGEIALRNIKHGRYLRMGDRTEISASGEKKAWESFRIASSDGDTVTIYSTHHQRFMRVNPCPYRNGGVDASDTCRDGVLPPHWQWEKFRIFQVGSVTDRAELPGEGASMGDMDVFVTGAGCQEVNGRYSFCGVYGDHPTWKQQGGRQFQLWRCSSAWQWRIGFERDYWYVSHSASAFQPVWAPSIGDHHLGAIAPGPRVDLVARMKKDICTDISSQKQAVRVFPDFSYKCEQVEGDKRVVRIPCPGVTEDDITIVEGPNRAIVTMTRHESSGLPALCREIRVVVDEQDGLFEMETGSEQLAYGVLSFRFFKNQPRRMFVSRTANSTISSGSSEYERLNMSPPPTSPDS